METVRHPAVAGRFYPKVREHLLRDLQSYLSPPADALPALGCVAPHAGYIYSGSVAGAVFARVAVPQTCILLCPNHTGAGAPLSIMVGGAWETPLGTVPIDSALAEGLRQSFPPLTDDTAAHAGEHAIEVELPFLQARRPDLKFVPIALGTAQFDVLETLGIAMAATIQARSEPVLIVASSDMNHYESDRITRVKDRRAIDRMLAFDPLGLHQVVTQGGVSMCGVGPAIVMLTAARRLGAASAELVKYATSGDVSGDREMVVGYAGLIVR